MDHLQQLLKQYWAGAATAEQRDELISLLEEKGMDISVILDNEPGNGSPGPDVLLSDSRSTALLQKMHETIGQPAPVAKTRRPWAAITAAAAAAAIITAILLVPHHPPPKIRATQNTPVLAHIAATPTEQTNNSASIEILHLEDGSTVALYPKSTVLYSWVADSTRRNIDLKGKAIFTVAKVANRPFSVTANGTVTTALGTKFSVSTFTAEEKVQVRLLEGKVMVRPVDGVTVYLKPGDECLTGGHNVATLVRSFTKPTPSVAQPPTTEDVLEFRKESLTNVFKKIEQRYNITITCSDKAIHHLSFTGKFLSTDPVEVVLNVICNTNDLLFQRSDNLVTIRKIK